MSRRTVKLLLMDPAGQVLLVHGRDPATTASYWYPVGGGLEREETPAQAALREAWEETGLDHLPSGTHVWTRRATYVHGGRTFDVHEDWLHFAIAHFDPSPGKLTPSEQQSIVGFRWWNPDEIQATSDLIYPPDLGLRLAQLEADGLPSAPIDIGLTTNS